MSAPSDGFSRVYVVFWPENGVLKVGYTSLKRWKRFVSTGAQLLGLYEFDHHMPALELESDLQEIAFNMAEPAFPEPSDESRELLWSKRSGGYLECVRCSRQTAEAVLAEAAERGLIPNA